MNAKPRLRVLDFTRVLAGPVCTMLLGDYGADVIKVERPGRGDDTRHWGPPWAGSDAARLSAYFLSVNRNKRSLTLNLQDAEGRALARRLALASDVLIENFRVGQMAAWGLDYDTLAAEHPGLVYCSISGYGQAGPRAHEPGYDSVIQAQSGLMAITGEADGEPMKIGVALSDVITGLFATTAIQAALLQREHGGRGQYVDVALLDAQLAAMVNIASNALVAGSEPGRYGNAHPSIVPYQTFQAADRTFSLAVGNDRQFARLCAIIEREDLAADPRFADNPARVQHRAMLIPQLEAAFAGKLAQHWIDAALAAGIPAGPINTVGEALADPQVAARGLVQDVTLADGSLAPMVGPVARLSAEPATIRHAPPALGQHTEEILRERLGLDAAAIAALRQRGIV